VALRVVGLDGRLVLAAHDDGAAQPAYFIVLDWDGGGLIRTIRDSSFSVPVPYSLFLRIGNREPARESRT
jgi:hypothetical protein